MSHEERDPLTGLYSRRLALDAFKKLLADAGETHTPISVIYSDVDLMRGYNETYGLSCGDELIRRIAAAIDAAVGGDGLTCRFSGDEFLTILPGFSSEAAGRKAEEMLLAARKVTYPAVVERGEPNCRSMTLGVAAYPKHGLELKAIIRAADEALFRGKQAGRGRVSTA